MRAAQVTRAAAIAALILAAGVAPAHADTPRAWWQVRVPGALVVGDAPPAQVAEVAVALGKARRVFVSGGPGHRAQPSAPLTVFVFADEATAAAFQPLFEGRSVEVGGAYLPGPEQHFITVAPAPRRDESPWRPAFHEFSHFLARQAWPDPPAWFDEGLAEFQSTVALDAAAGVAELGRPPAAHLALLAAEPALPLPDLLAVTRESAFYNEGARRGMFYAQSWLLSHYLIAGNPDRAPQLFEYLRLRAGGTPLEDAFDRAFGAPPAVLEKELQDYLSRGRFPVRRVALPAGTPAEAAAVEPLAAHDVEALQAELLLRLQRPHEARDRLERALALDARHARALSALGALSASEQQFGEARSLLSRAAALAPDDPLVQWRWAKLLAGEVSRAEDEAARAADLEALRLAARRLDAPSQGPEVRAAARAWLDAVQAARARPRGGR